MSCKAAGKEEGRNSASKRLKKGRKQGRPLSVANERQAVSHQKSGNLRRGTNWKRANQLGGGRKKEKGTQWNSRVKGTHWPGKSFKSQLKKALLQQQWGRHKRKERKHFRQDQGGEGGGQITKKGGGKGNRETWGGN